MVLLPDSVVFGLFEQGLLSSLSEDRGALSASLLPDIIELCLSRLHPVLIVQADCPEEVQRAFFELVSFQQVSAASHSSESFRFV